MIPADADRFVDELGKRFPASTASREISIPQIRAAAALKRNQSDQALAALRSFRRWVHASPASAAATRSAGCTSGARHTYASGTVPKRSGRFRR